MPDTRSRKAFIHIGMNKTGSTSVQRYLYEKRQVGDYSYPVFENDISHFRAAIQFGFYGDLLANTGYNDPVFAARFAELLTAHDKVILSSEHFSEVINFKALVDFKRYMENIGFHDIKIILVVRDPASYFDSFYREIVKWGSCETKNDFITRNAMKRIMFDVYDVYSEVFGNKNIHVIEYDSKDTISPICKILDSDFSIPNPELYRENKSLTAMDTELFRMINECTEDSALKRRIFESLSNFLNDKVELQSKDGLFEEQTLDPITQGFIERLQKQYTTRLAKLRKTHSRTST